MEHPLNVAIRNAQAHALKMKQTIYVIQDGLHTYSFCTVAEYSTVYPIKAIINADGLIAAKND